MSAGTPSPRYALSFTCGALLIREAQIAASLYLVERSWAAVRDRMDTDNLLQARTYASGFRLAREVTQRLAVLTEDELMLLQGGQPY